MEIIGTKKEKMLMNVVMDLN